MASYIRTTLGTLKTRLRERAGSTGVFWTDPELRYAINEAIRVWNALTGMWNATQGAPAVQGAAFHDVPRQLVGTRRVRYGNTVLTPTSLFDLDNGFGAWQGAAASTPLYWTPVGLNKIATSPPTTVGTLTYEGIQLAPKLLNDADYIDIGDEELSRILDYGHWYLTFKEGGKELEGASGLITAFVEAAVLKNRRLLAAGIFKNYLGDARDETQRPDRAAAESVGGR